MPRALARHSTIAAVVVCILASCSDPGARTDSGGADAGTPTDAAPEVDAGTDLDAALEVDAGTDLDVRGSTDAPPEVPDASPDAPIDTSAMVLSGQEVRVVDTRTLTGDVYIPEGAGPFPAVLVIHGGGFANGAPDGMAEIAWATTLQAAGFVAFCVDYRVNRDFDRASGEPNFPAPLEDLKCALRWLRHRAAAFRVDAEHVFSLGGSAGGNLSALLAVTGGEPGYDTACGGAEGESDRLQGAVDYFGPVDFPSLVTQRGTEGLGMSEALYAGSECTSEPDISTLCRNVSVAGHLQATDPPFYVAHSDDDPVVPVQQSRDLVALLGATGVDAQYHEVTGQRHGWHSAFRNEQVAAVRDEVLAWLSTLASR